MSFVVEDGSGTNPAANSYVSVAEFRNFWADHGFDTVPFTDSQVQVALMQTTEYLEQRFALVWYGAQLLPGTQPLSWPRQCIWIDCALLPPIPNQLKKAVFEYAKRQVGGKDLLPDPTNLDATGQPIKSSTVKVGPIEKTVAYANTGLLILELPSADFYLRGLKFDSASTAIR